MKHLQVGTVVQVFGAFYLVDHAKSLGGTRTLTPIKVDSTRNAIELTPTLLESGNLVLYSTRRVP